MQPRSLTFEPNSISPPPDFGANLTLVAFETQINALSAKLDTYHQMLSLLDDMQNQVDAEEASLRETSKRMLSAAEAHYGPDSSQYEQAGGTRESERKRPTREDANYTCELTTGWRSPALACRRNR